MSGFSLLCLHLACICKWCNEVNVDLNVQRQCAFQPSDHTDSQTPPLTVQFVQTIRHSIDDLVW